MGQLWKFSGGDPFLVGQQMEHYGWLVVGPATARFRNRSTTPFGTRCSSHGRACQREMATRIVRSVATKYRRHGEKRFLGHGRAFHVSRLAIPAPLFPPLIDAGARTVSCVNPTGGVGSRQAVLQAISARPVRPGAGSKAQTRSDRHADCFRRWNRRGLQLQ
jgi:hypothetical protein